VSECIGARSWFPCNDHPRDKATFAITVTVPAPWTAAANGLLAEERQDGDRRTYVWRARDPMATYLATVAIARFDERHGEGPRGMPLRLYVPPGTSAETLEVFGDTGRMIELFERHFGPYPFESFGGVLAEFSLGGALETQTLPIYSPGTRASTVAHELAHQWFGNSVTVARWSDLWLSEGFASYAEWLWDEHENGADALARRVRRTYGRLRRGEVGPPVDPGVRELFSARVYSRGAWVLHALRGEVGDETFFAILRGWAALLGGANATPEDFLAHCERVAGRDLDAFFAGVLRAPVIARVEALERPARGAPGDGEDGDGEDGG
jgi:aminopeptidase N